MSTKLKKINSFKSRVHFLRPTDDPDRDQEASFVAEFHYMDAPTFDAMLAGSPKDAEVLDRVLIGVTEYGDENGNALSFEAAKEAIEKDISQRSATVRTFIERLSGTAAKNSNRSR